jgi:PKD repeat protein
LRFISLLISMSAVSMLLLMLMPTAGAIDIIVNASYDGGVGSDIHETWFEMRDTDGNSVHLLAPKVYSGMTESNNTTEIYENHWRGLVTWDTSDIPNDAIISSAVVSVYGISKHQDLGTFNFSVIDATPYNKSAYIESDYDKTTFTRMASDIPFASFNNEGWNEFTLNPLGLTHISKTGLTTFMFTHSADVDNSSLTWKGGLDSELDEPASGFYFRGVNYNDTPGNYKPFITITYIGLVVTPPVANFTANVTSGYVPLTVQFNDTSAGSSIYQWNWSFGDGTAWYNTTSSGARNITHTYTTADTYIAKLMVTNASGSNTTNPGTTITVNAVPTLTMDKIGIYKNGMWYLDNSGNGAWGAGDSVHSFGGTPGYTSIIGDWNATGFTYIGIYKDGVWYLDWNGNGVWDGPDKAYSFGARGWINVTGDWNHDGKTDIGVTNGQQWYLDMNNNGSYDSGVDKAYSFGAPGWTPVIGDWNKTGNSYIGITNGQVWYLDWNGNGAWDSGDKAYSFGAPGWAPVVGIWS